MTTIALPVLCTGELKIEGLYYLCSENKGVDQLRGYHEADRNREADLRLCFGICKMLVFSKRGSLMNVHGGQSQVCLHIKQTRYQPSYCAQ